MKTAGDMRYFIADNNFAVSRSVDKPFNVMFKFFFCQLIAFPASAFEKCF
jgi:hypothetical protein